MLRRALGGFIALAAVVAMSSFAGSPPAAAVALPSGFQEQVVFSGLSSPVDLEFAPDGRILVAEKGGRIKVFDDLADTTPTVFADLSANVHNQWDRGLIGMALAPNFPADPYVYVLYTYDAPPGGTAPKWNDVCPDANNGNSVWLRPSFGVANASLAITPPEGPYKLTLFVKNIFNEHYVAGLRRISGSVGGAGAVAQYLPRDFDRYFGATVSIGF